MTMFQDRQEQILIKSQILEIFLKKFGPPSGAHFSKDLPTVELSDDC